MPYNIHDMTTTETVKGYDAGFIGIQYLAEKFNYSPEKILELFIDSDYSISRTVEYLRRLEAA
jgi:hypothetical protein